jgi:hypothetical protein
MVTVNDFAIRQNADGEDFVVLILQGGLEMVRSQETGNYYATIRKCSVSSTFDEETAKLMVGQQLPGTIAKVECEPYEYVVEETGEQLLLSHTWQYQPEPTPVVTQPIHIIQENGIPVTV